MADHKRPESMERITTPALAEQFIAEQVAAIRAQVGDKKVLLALSGGVVMGEAMSRAKWLEVHGQREQAGAARRRAWLLPAVLHGLYDFLLVGFGWIFYGYFAGLVVYVVRLLRQSAREDGPINL